MLLKRSIVSVYISVCNSPLWRACTVDLFTPCPSGAALAAAVRPCGAVDWCRENVFWAHPSSTQGAEKSWVSILVRKAGKWYSYLRGGGECMKIKQGKHLPFQSSNSVFLDLLIRNTQPLPELLKVSPGKCHTAMQIRGSYSDFLWRKKKKNMRNPLSKKQNVYIHELKFKN